MSHLHLATLCVFALPAPVSADPPALDAAARDRVVDRLAAMLVSDYVDPEVGKAAAAAVRDKHTKKEYDPLADGKAFADRLTADLQAVTKDKHLRVGFSPEPQPAPTADAGPTPEEMAAHRRGMARMNHGLGRVEVLPGNVGYVDIRVFCDPADTAAKWAGVFALVADADALVLDLRECGGAVSPDATPLVCSYLFDEPLHLYSIYWRPADTTRQFWTHRSVPGPKFLSKDVYVLTSRKTFSGAEQLAYDLQAHKRATVIGEASGGGAHPGGTRRIDDHFDVWLPVGRPTNPITKGSWEGVGVKPDIETDPADALLVTRRKVATKLLAGPIDHPAWRAELERVAKEVEGQLAERRKGK